MRFTHFAVRGAFSCGIAVCASASAADWTQFGYDGAHSGNNTAETTISAANVAQLGAIYPQPVTLSSSTAVDSAPVYKSGVVTATGSKDMLFLLSQNGRIMAIDSADGSEVWSHQTSGTQPATASPAIDPNGLFVYSYGTDGKAHKYQIDDGTETMTDDWPQAITYKPSVEKGAGGFTIATSGGVTYLVVVTDGYIGDGGDYQGHLTSINLSTNTQNTFNVMCSDQTIHFALNGTAGVDDCASRQSGIWGRGGATFDAATDRVYIATGNGQFNANTANGFNWGDSVLALAVDGTGSGAGLPRDSYTPTNYQALDSQDIDLGSISPAILPVPAGSTVAHLGMQVGKDAKLRLIDLDNMSGAGAPGHVGGEVQTILNVPQGGGGMREQPAVWVDPVEGSTWLFVANGQGISGLQLGLDANNKPLLTARWTKTTSSNSPAIANGVLYVAGGCSGGTCVVARDPLTGNVLWTSPHIGNLHWQSPIVVDAAVYMTDGSRKLWKFGIVAGTTHTVTPVAGSGGTIAPNTPQTIADGATTAFVITPDAHFAIASVDGCGGTLDGTTYTTAAITADCTVTASFAAINHVVTPVPGAFYGVDPADPQTVNEGDTFPFTINLVSAAYFIESVTGCDGDLVDSVFTAGPVTADCSFTVNVGVSDAEIVFSNGFDSPTR